MRSHDKFTPRGIFAPRGKFAPGGKLMHINGALEGEVIMPLLINSLNTVIDIASF